MPIQKSITRAASYDGLKFYNLLNETKIYKNNLLRQGITPRVEQLIAYNNLQKALKSTAAYANLAAWYSGDIGNLGVETDTSGNVSNLKDLTGRGRHLLQTSASLRPIYLRWAGENYINLPGIPGNYASTPDSAAVSITGDIDIRAKVTLNDWTPSAAMSIVAKEGGTSTRSFRINVLNTSAINLMLSSDGSIQNSANSSVTTGFTDMTTHWIRATWRQSDGRVQFFTSEDGITWSQLGTDQSIAISSIFDSTSVLEMGSRFAGGVENTSGKIYYAEIRNGIDGTVVARFNPQEATNNASSFVSSTGETWTINTSGGNPAQIIGKSSLLFDGTNDALLSSAFSLVQPETVYFVGKQITWTDLDTFYDGGGDNTMALRQRSNTPQLNITAGTDTGGRLEPALNTLFITSAVYNGTSSIMRLNKDAEVTQSNAGTNDANGFMLGGRTADRFANFQFYEALVFSTSHDTETQNKFIEALGALYGISV